jgi:hypothetical protein
VAPTLYGVIGDGAVLGGLRHPTMHPMQPLRRGLGLCHVRTQVAMDEPLSAVRLPRLTESVLGYLEEVSRRTPVVYVACGEDGEAAAGWRGGRLVLGPLTGESELPRHGLLRRRDAGPVDAALHWLGVRGRDRLAAVGLSERAAWEPTSAAGSGGGP